jgi:hypothetical protein
LQLFHFLETQLVFEDELNKTNAETNGETSGTLDLLRKGSIEAGKEAAMKAEASAALERQNVPLEKR